MNRATTLLNSTRARMGLGFLAFLIVLGVVAAAALGRHREQSIQATLGYVRTHAQDRAAAVRGLLALRTEQAVAAARSHLVVEAAKGQGDPRLALEGVRQQLPDLRVACLIRGANEVLTALDSTSAEVCEQLGRGGDWRTRHYVALSGSALAAFEAPVLGDISLRIGVEPRRLNEVVAAGAAMETYLTGNDGTLLTRPRRQPLPLGSQMGPPTAEWRYRDYRGVEVLGAQIHVPEEDVWVRTEVDLASVDAVSTIPTSDVLLYVLVLAVALLAIMWVVGGSIIRPLKDAVRASSAIAAGRFETELPVAGPTETRELSHAINLMATELHQQYVALEFKVAERTAALSVALDRQTELSQVTQNQAEELRAQNEELQAQARELRDFQEELRGNQALLQEQNGQLARASRLKSEFLANMSHELRTPLNAIIGFSDLMLERIAGELNSEQAEYVADIHRSGKHLLALINDVLDLSKIEAGQMRLRLERVDAALTLHEAGEMIRGMATQKGISLEIRGDVEGLFCLADRQRLLQVVLNLTSNAVKFTPDGGAVTLAAKVSADGRWAELTVTDTGIGIAPEHHGLVFEEFRQVDSTLAREQGGTGLGLALVRKFLEQMGGTVHLRSSPGAGSSFTARLPLAVAQQPSPALPARPAEPVALDILIAEDDPASRELLTRLLRPRGHSLRVAQDGDAALAQLAASLPDVLVLDLMMPRVDGFGVLRALREMEGHERVRVVVLSAKDLMPAEQELLDGKVTEVIAKGSIETAAFLERVECSALSQDKVAA